MKYLWVLALSLSLLACHEDRYSGPGWIAPETPEVDAGLLLPPPVIVDAGVDSGPQPDPQPVAGHPAAPKGGAGGASAGAGGEMAGRSAAPAVAGSGGMVAAGGVGGAGEDAGTAGASGSESPAPVACKGPEGLYQDTQCQVLAAGVQEYAPQFPLWTDGAVKQRWVYLPPGTINASDADQWVFPVGTRFWKEFRSTDGATKIETRMLTKVANTTDTSGWTYDTCVWDVAQTTCTVTTEGVTNALGSGLNVPAKQLCTSCHNHNGSARDMVNGFQGIQLNWAGAGITLQSLISSGKLSDYRTDIVSTAVIPGRNATETAAFGYFHGNCGHCHTAKVSNGVPTFGDDAPHSLALRSLIGVPLASQPAWTTTVCVYPHTPLESFATQRIAPGNPTNSALYNRDRVRGSQHPDQVDPPATPVTAAPGDVSGSIQMPPVGTIKVDSAAMTIESQWITGLTVNATTGKCLPN